MILPDLQRATLLKRYKRFLADVEYDDGTVETVHCANPGAMTGLLPDRAEVWVSTSPNLKRKLPRSLELIDVGTSLVMVNTARTNAIVAHALAAGDVSLGDFPTVTAEVKVGDSRLDFLLEGSVGQCWLEVKQVTLCADGVARFPDSRTKRGQKHLETLQSLIQPGVAAAMAFVVTRSDAEAFEPSDDIDPDYAAAFRSAQNAGVQMHVFDCEVSTKQVRIRRSLPLTIAAAR